MRLISPETYDSRELTSCARAWSSQRSGAEACSSSTTRSRRSLSTSRTFSMLRRVASRVLSCSEKSAVVTTLKTTPPGRCSGRAVAVRSLRGSDLEPTERGLVVGHRELQGGGAVRVAGLLGFLGLFPGHGQRLRVVL